MRSDEIEAAALRLAPVERARLAAKLLESLEHLTEEENARIWAEEAKRRDENWDPSTARPADQVHGDLRKRQDR